MENKGILKIHLSKLLKASGMSKNKFCQKAEIQHSQLKGYMDNTITRLDTDVLIRICHTLDCSIAELLEYVSPEQQKTTDRKPHQSVVFYFAMIEFMFFYWNYFSFNCPF